ncbi:hypothetical protein [Pedobacter mucosus]|uniref:hypothetical protein n=1 Tax=Pedobacter mucosus TaxID=2895286 RepID=UPI001EE3B9CA|nr:hypothetical protein [Pedobacter mucosus]UKT63403.1 hypothetical protein LOK61_16735 [Pedobacter mucosus]
MRLSRFILLILIYSLASCINSPLFDQEVWINNPKGDQYSPRARMVDDIMKNYLKPGMSKKEVIKLLGNPYYDGIEKRLPKNVIMPDSLKYSNDDSLDPKIADKKMNYLNKFYALYAEPVKILWYPVGWSTIDPNFLVIKLSRNDLVEDYWVEQR